MPMRQYHSGVAQWWQYPLARPSDRFTQINHYIRGLDVRYAGLTTAYHNLWDRYGVLYPWWQRCLPWIFDYDPFEQSPADGLACYRSYNASNLVNALPVSDLPPGFVTVPDADTITVVASVATTVVWSGRPAAPTGDYSAVIKAVALNHEPEQGPALSKYSWVGVVPVIYGANLDLSFVWSSRPGFAAMPYTSVAVAIGDKAGVPFVGKRVGFSYPY